MDMVTRVNKVNYDEVAEGVRHFCAEKLYELEKALRPMVDGTFGEILPGHLAGYLTLIKQLGMLYQVSKPPRELMDVIPTSKVQEMLARMEAAHQAALSAAVSAAEERVRMEMASGSRLSIEQAKAAVSTRLMELEKRGNQ